MQINFQSEPITPLWEGALEPSGVTYRGTAGSFASIGTPFHWSSGQMLGEKWQPPAGWGYFYLVRLSFSLRPASGCQVEEAQFRLKLDPQGALRAVAFDAYPQRQVQERPRPVTLGLGLGFKLGEVVEAKVAKAETTFDFGNVLPVVELDGLQQSELCWRFTAHAKHPLSGSRLVCAVLALPAGMPTVLARLELEAKVRSKMDILRLFTPENARRNLSCVIGQRP